MEQDHIVAPHLDADDSVVRLHVHEDEARNGIMRDSDVMCQSNKPLTRWIDAIAVHFLLWPGLEWLGVGISLLLNGFYTINHGDPECHTFS
jgi:hypothetical protein